MGRVARPERSKVNWKDKTWTRPNDVHDGDAFAIKVVAVARGEGHWQCYSGPSDWSDEEVAAKGESVYSEAAKSLFYVMCLRRYLP